MWVTKCHVYIMSHEWPFFKWKSKKSVDKG